MFFHIIYIAVLTSSAASAAPTQTITHQEFVAVSSLKACNDYATARKEALTRTVVPGYTLSHICKPL